MSERTYVDLFEFKSDGDRTNVDIVTIEQNNARNTLRCTSPYRDRVQERYNRSLSPTGSPRQKRKNLRSASPLPLKSPNKTPYKNSMIPTGYSPLKFSPIKSPNKSDNVEEETRRLRFECLILQSKVETLESENKMLKESNSYLNSSIPDNDSAVLSREVKRLKSELALSSAEVERMRKENDDLTTQLYSLKVDRLEKPKDPKKLSQDPKEDWTGCQADAIEHLCAENQQLRETLFEMNEQKIHVHRLLEKEQLNNDGKDTELVRKRLNSCQLDNTQLSEERNRLNARLEKADDESKKGVDKYSQLREDYNKALSQISQLQSQCLKLEQDQTETSNKRTEEQQKVQDLSERCNNLQKMYDSKEEEHQREIRNKETELLNRIDMHLLKQQDLDDEIRRVSHVCDMMCQEKDNVVHTLQGQMNTNDILARSNEQLQHTVQELSNRVRDFVQRQIRDGDYITELKSDFEVLLSERNDLEARLCRDSQNHLLRLATLREQINMARLTFNTLTSMLENDPNMDNEKRQDLLNQLAETDAQLSALQRQILDMERMEAENAQLELDDVTLQYLRKSEQCEVLQSQLSAVELDKSRLNQKKMDLETTLDKTELEANDFEQKYEESKQTLHKLQIENDTLKSQLKKVKIKLGIIEDDRNDCEVQAKDLKRQNSDLQDNCNDINSNLNKTKRKLHQKESVSDELSQQLEGQEIKNRKLLNQISQLQKSMSRSTIQIGLLNEEMRVALKALADINKELDSEIFEEHLENLLQISSEFENLELALEKTLCSNDTMSIPLRGESGAKIARLKEELDFCKETIEELRGKRRPRDDGKMTMTERAHTAYNRIQHQLEGTLQEKLLLLSQLKLAQEQCKMYKETLSEKEKQLTDAEDALVIIQQHFEPFEGPSKTRHKPTYPNLMSNENMRSLLDDRDNLIRTLKSELKRSSQQTKSIINQNVHCNDLIVTQREMIDRLQTCLDNQECQYALLLSSYRDSCGDRLRQMYENKCEQTEVDPLFESLCRDHTESTGGKKEGEKGEAKRLKKVVIALKKALDEEKERRKNSSKDYDNLKSDIKKLAIKLEADGQLFIASADAACEAGVSHRDGICQTYLPGSTPSKLSNKAGTQTDKAEVQTEEDCSEASVSHATQTVHEDTPEDVGDPKELYRAKSQLQKDLKKMAKENLHLKDSLDAAKTEVKDLKNKVKVLIKGDPSAIAAELLKTSDSNAESRKIISELLSEKEQLSGEIDENLRPKLDGLIAENDALNEKLKNLNQQFAAVSAERKALLDEKLAFKPEPPGSTEVDGDVLKENIRLQTKVHNLYQETLKLKSKTRAAKAEGFAESSTECDATGKDQRISTLEELSEKIETSLSASYNQEDMEALKEQVLELQNALEDAHATIEEYKANPLPAPTVDAPVVEAVEVAVVKSERGGEEGSVREKESKTTQTEMPAGPTRVQLLVKIAIIGTKLTHRTKTIETLEVGMKEKDKVIVAKDEEIETRELKISDLDELITVKEAELEENRTEIGSFQEKMEEFEKLLAAKQKEIEDLVFQAEEEASKTASAGANLEDVAAWKTKYAEVKAQKKKLQGSINFANKTLDEYKVNIDMLTSKVVQTDEDMNSFFTSITDILKHDPICATKNFGYISEKDKLTSAKNIIFKFVEFTTVYSSKQEELANENKATKEKLTATTDKAEDLFKKLENVQGDLDRTKNILETSQQELASKSAALNFTKNKLDGLQLEFDNQTTELADVKAGGAATKEELAKIQDELKRTTNKLDDASKNIAEKEQALEEKDKSIAEKEKDIEATKSQLKTLSEKADISKKDVSEKDEEDEGQEAGDDDEDGDDANPSTKQKSIKDKTSSKPSSKAESIKKSEVVALKTDKSQGPDKAIMSKLLSIDKEVVEIDRDIARSKAAIEEIIENDDDDEEKRKKLLEALSKMMERLSEKNKILSALCQAQGIKSKPKKNKEAQTQFTIPPNEEVDMPGEEYSPESEQSSTDTLSDISDITDRTMQGSREDHDKIQDLQNLLELRDLEVKELKEKIEEFRKLSPSPASPIASVHDEPSQDIAYWEEKAKRMEGYKKKCAVLEKDLRLSNDEVTKLRKQLIKTKSQESSAREDLDDQLKNLQKQLEEDMKRQKDMEESIKQCKEEQKQEQENLQQTLLAAIQEKQKVISDLMNKKKGEDENKKSLSSKRSDVKSEINKVVEDTNQTFSDLQKKYQVQVNVRDEDILKLKSDLRDVTKQKSEVSSDLEDYRNKVERLENKINLLEQDLNDDSGTYKAFKQEIGELSDILDEKIKKIKVLNNELFKLNNTVQYSNDQVEQATKRMREAEIARNEISEQSIDNQHKADLELKAKAKSAREINARCKALAAQVESLKNVLEKKHEVGNFDIENKLEIEMDPEIAKTMNQKDLLEKIRKLTEQLNKTEKKRIDLKVDFKATLTELDALNGLLEEKEKDRDHLVKLVTQLRREMEHFKAEENTSRSDRHSVSDSSQFYTEDEYAQLQNELEDMAQELRAADEHRKNIQKQRRQEKAQFNRMRAELAKRIEEYACLLAVHNKLENSIANLEEQNLQQGMETERQRVEVLGLRDILSQKVKNAEKTEEMCRSKNSEIEELKGSIAHILNDCKSLSNDTDRLKSEHEIEKNIWMRSLKDVEQDRNMLLQKIETLSTAAMAQTSGGKKNSNVDHAKRFVNILKDLNQDRVTSASATQRLEFTALQNEITDLRRKLELTDNKRAHLVHELKRTEYELQELRDTHAMKSDENKSFINQITSYNTKIAKLERKVHEATTGLKHERQCGELLLEENRHLYADKEKSELSIEELSTSLKCLLSEVDYSNSRIKLLTDKLAHCEQLSKNLQKVNKLKTGDNFELVELNAHLLEKLHVHEPVDVISEELDELRQQIQPNRGLTEMMYEVEILQNERSKLENELNLIKCKENEAIKHEKNKQKLTLSELQNKLTIVQANNEGTQEFILNLNTENNELKNQLIEAQNEAEMLDDQVNDKQKEIQKLNQNMANMQKSNTPPPTPPPNNDLTEENQALKDEISHLNSEIQLIEEENQTIKNLISRNESEYTDAIEKSKCYENMVEDFHKEIASQEKNIETQKATIRSYSNQMSDANNQLTSMAEENWDLADKISAANESNESKDVIMTELKKKCEMLENKVSVLSLDNNVLLQEMSEVTGELNKHEDEADRRGKLDETVKEVISQNERLSEENERLQAEVRGKEIAFNNLKKAQSSDGNLKNQLRCLKEENTTLQAELTDVQGSCKKLSLDNSRLSEASSALEMINTKVKELKQNNDQLRKALKKELTRDEARYLTKTMIDRIIKKLNDSIPDEIRRLQSLLSSKELDIQRLEVEVDSLHGELVEADKVMIAHGLTSSSSYKFDNRDLYEVMKDASVASRKVKILQNQLEDYRITVRDVFNENKTLLNIVKEVESLQEESLHSQSAHSIGSGTSYTMNFANHRETDLKTQVLELQQRLEAAHNEVEKYKKSRGRSPVIQHSPPAVEKTTNICPRCRARGGSELEEAQVRELLEDKERDVATTEERIDTLKEQIGEMELKMRSTHHGPGSSMVALSKETYAMKRQLRICESRLEDLWKEREEVSLELRKLTTGYTRPDLSKYSKADVIAELKLKMKNSGSPVQDAALRKENIDLRGHVTEMMEYIDQQQKSLQELKMVKQDKEELEQQVQELSQFLDSQVPDNDIDSAVSAAVAAVREEYETALTALQSQSSKQALEDKETCSALREEVAQCVEDGENMSMYRTNATRDNLRKQSAKLKAILSTLDNFLEQKEVEEGSQGEPSLLQILILGSGDVKVKCSGGSSSAVVVQQVQGCPDDEAERAQWCSDLESAVDVIKRGGRVHDDEISVSSLTDERILLKIVLQLPPAFHYSIKLD